MSKKSEVSCNIINEAILSIALQEAALAHILNAEGEKIQKGIASTNNIGDLLCLNASVQSTLVDVTNLEIVLSNKLKTLLACGCECGKQPPAPCPKPCPKLCQKGELIICVYTCNCDVPICNARIEVFDKNKNRVACGKTLSCGCYHFKGLDEGCYHVVIYDTRSEEKQEVVISITAREKEITKKICFKHQNKKQICLMGIVIDARGNPMIDTTVVASGKNEIRTYTDQCGHYEIANLEVDDKYDIYAVNKTKISKTYTNTTSIREDYHYEIKIVF